MTNTPLKGIKVVGLTHFVMGPLGLQILGDLGADVIAIEPVEGSFQRKFAANNILVEGQTTTLLLANRNKRSLALDLKTKEGMAIVRKLIDKADVVAENFRPGVLEKLGLGYETLRKTNSRLIYASATGYGPDGPYVDRPGQDLLIQALSGLAAINGSPDDKARAAGVSVVDHHGAALLALGIVSAIVGRNQTGQGCRVDVDLLSSALDLQAESLTCYLNGKPRSVTSEKYMAGWHLPAPYGIYPAADGHLAISLNPFPALASALDVPVLAEMSVEDGYTRKAEVCSLVAAALLRRTVSEWCEILSAAKIWHAPVQDYDAVLNDPQIRHNKTFFKMRGANGVPIKLVNHPIRYDGQFPPARMPPQRLGAQTSEILSEIGYSKAEIDTLLQSRVVKEALDGEK